MTNNDATRALPQSASRSRETDDSRVARAVEEYQAQLDAGARPDPRAFLDKHADIAEPLAECLAGLEFVHSAALELNRLTGATAGPPAALGDYRIVREAGRGGMGVVYEAEQLSLRRRVALKVLPFAAIADPRHLQRFRNEAVAAAGLDHPNVVKVYGIGCERGTHYIAMQFIEGRSLADLIKERRGEHEPPVQDRTPPTARAGDMTMTHVPAAANPVPGVPTAPAAVTRAVASAATAVDRHYARQVATWGIQGADALEHAHTVGVVHRDIKPGNLLIDGLGQLFVADFGLAQLASDPGVTSTGDLLGTPRYMSPEQAGARHNLVDHRTDVYSLGATLYELLTLAPPFPGSDRMEIISAITTSDPVPPQHLDRSIPRDLETIVLKCLCKEPEGRYQSARELAEDLRRFLEDRPIQARPPGLRQRAAKWARRHRVLVGSAIALLAVVAVLSTTAAVLVWQETRAKKQALADRGAALEEKEEALRALKVALTEAREQREAAKRGETQAVAARRKAQDTLALALKGSRLMPDWLKVAEMDKSFDRPVAIMRHRTEVMERALAEEPENRSHRHELSENYNAFHFFLDKARRLNGAVPTCRRGVELMEMQAAEMLAANPKENLPGSRLMVAYATLFLGEAHLASGEAAEAERVFRKALADWDVAFAPYPSFREAMGREAVKARVGLARAIASQGRYADAEAELRRALTFLDDLSKSSMARTMAHSYPLVWHQLGDLLWAAGRKKEAGEAYAAALKHWEPLAKKPGDHPAHAGLAWLLAACPDPAIRDPRKAIELAKAIPGGVHGAPLAALTLRVAECRFGNPSAGLKVAFSWNGCSPADEAIVASATAVAFRRLGNEKSAHELLARAHKAAGQCGQIPDAQRLLDEATEQMAVIAPPPRPASTR